MLVLDLVLVYRTSRSREAERFVIVAEPVRRCAARARPVRLGYRMSDATVRRILRLALPAWSAQAGHLLADVATRLGRGPAWRSTSCRRHGLPQAGARANCYAGRWARTVQSECTDRMLIYSANHLQAVLWPTPVQRREIPGGVINEYHWTA